MKSITGLGQKTNKIQLRKLIEVFLNLSLQSSFTSDQVITSYWSAKGSQRVITHHGMSYDTIVDFLS